MKLSSATVNFWCKRCALIPALLCALFLCACAQNEHAADTGDTANDIPAVVQSTAPVEEPAGSKLVCGVLEAPTGDLGYGWWGGNAADAVLRELIDDYALVTTDSGGKVVVNRAVCADIAEAANADGSKTYTITLNDGLTYNNGDPITATDYLACALIALSPEAADAGADTAEFAACIQGGEAYRTGETRAITGLAYVGERSFRITVPAKACGTYYDLLNLQQLQPLPLELFFPRETRIVGMGGGLALEGVLTETALNRARFLYESRISAGPYTIEAYDANTGSFTLKRNEHYVGNFEGRKPSIETIVLRPLEPNSLADALSADGIDFIDVGMALSVEFSSDQLAALTDAGGYTLYQFPRSGYGQMVFQCDRGPTQFKAVRHAVAYLFDRETFADQFCQGSGSVVHGPYSPTMWMYRENEAELTQKLNAYVFSVDAAIAELKADGWVLNEAGAPYTEGLRWREVTADEAGDYPYCVTLPDGRILMPLKMDLPVAMSGSGFYLIESLFADSDAVSAAGMEIDVTELPFSELLDRLYRNEDPAGYCLFNLARNFSVRYDMSGDFTRDPALLAEGWNYSFADDVALEMLSHDMVYGVAPGDDATFSRMWTDFVLAYNDCLPELPLYQNLYGCLVGKNVSGLTPNDRWDLGRAVVYAEIG